MLILFRADGNSMTGSGHIMRCLSIANEAKRRGHHTLFVTAGNEFEDIITSRGHEIAVMNTDYTDMPSELDRFMAVINARHPQTVIIDSYYVTESYLKALKESGRVPALIYIDDVSAFPYPCDMLLNYNIYGPDAGYKALYSGSGVHEPKFLLGTAYAPLREEFQNLLPRQVKKTAADILVSTGGADAEHMGLSLLREVLSRKRELEHLRFHFIIGSMNGDRDAIRSLASGMQSVVLHENVTDMSRLMQQMDLAVSAAGSTLYELCATQTPSVTYVLADNQIPGAEGFMRHGILKSAGDVRELGSLALAERLVSVAVAFAADYEKRISVSRKMRTVVDGRGAERILEELGAV